MPNNDWFNKIKEKLIILNLNSVSRVVDIMDIYMNYPTGFTNINLAESFDKLRVINKLNLEALREVLNYINHLEETSKEFSKEELINMVEVLELAYKSQDKFALDTINYILIEEEVITDKEEVSDKSKEYQNSNIYGYDLVCVTNKKIKRKIKKERRDNLE